MNCEFCKSSKCKFYESFFHGFNSNYPVISCNCLYTLKDPAKVAENECYIVNKGETGNA